MTYEEADKVLPRYKNLLGAILGLLNDDNIKITFNPYGGDRRQELNTLNDLCSEFYHEQNRVTFIVTLGNDEITRFSLVEFPGCCAIMVSTGAKVAPHYRRKGINKLMIKLRQEIALNAGYTALICTDVDSNIAERKTLAKESFKDIYSIKNKRTSNLVHVSIKEL